MYVSFLSLEKKFQIFGVLMFYIGSFAVFRKGGNEMHNGQGLISDKIKLLTQKLALPEQNR